VVGNDVVDLRDPESDASTLHPRWDARVFNRAEQRQLSEQGRSSSLRWKLWAAKEATYKLVRKLDAQIVFSPPKFEVQLGREGQAHVSFGSMRFPVRLMAAADGIHAIAREPSDDEQSIISGHRRIGPVADAAAPGREARVLAVTQIAAALAADPGEFEVRRERRIPMLWRGDRPCDLDLSLSHHGELVGFACAT
jgi:phosphopantetheinyl transferase (holo-ACP synthase)